MHCGFGELHEQKLKVKVPWGSQLKVHTHGQQIGANQGNKVRTQSQRESKWERHEVPSMGMSREHIPT
jgi:hypothetical protein